MQQVSGHSHSVLKRSCRRRRERESLKGTIIKDQPSACRVLPCPTRTSHCGARGPTEPRVLPSLLRRCEASLDIYKLLQTGSHRLLARSPGIEQSGFLF
ncbi:unnamed protein product [Pleuronectes platessa]|uniref:Uncharacterized protein n=1 Tax=Pleuronectes platessa TaxID=8262 RepID=A0A9N7UMK1_PLEPL|nr:unnamed protein product [Pleuronectes platessa]